MDVKITYGIEFEDAEVEEEDEDEDAPPNIGTLLNTESLKEIINLPTEEDELDDISQLYSFFVYWFDDRVVFTLDEMDGFDASKSFKQSYENLDEVLSMFEGFKHDFMEISENETASSFEVASHLDTVEEFIEQKIALMVWKDTKPLKYLNGRYKQKKVEPIVIEEYSNQDYLTAREVMRKLRISDQTLANWRRSSLIDFKKISNRKYLYMVESVNQIFENGVDTSGIANVPEQKVTPTPQTKPKALNYKAEVIALLKPIAFKIPEYKYQKQNFFLNFGNVGIASSPQVMISDDFQLVDFIKKTVLKETPEELYQYLMEIRNDGKEPRIDTSKKIQTGFSKFYLNKLFDKEMVSN
jgi:hypothetical protein